MVDPVNVGAAAGKLENENIRFRTFLKTHADSCELDRQILALHNELFADYDCRECANCCRAYSTSLAEDDVDRISAFLAMTGPDFVEKHLTLSPEGYEIKAPCGFLEENGACAIQDCKPAECVDFPHTDKPGRLESLYSILSFAEVCPVVFEILQRLKALYGFRR